MLRNLALFAARQAVGHSMAAHGAQKALGWFEGPGPDGAGKMLEGLGFRPGATYASLAAWNEIVSGELIALGFGGPIGPALLISNMIVAQLSVHAKNGFFAQKGGVELGVLYSAGALALAADFGAISADQVFGLREPLKHPLFFLLTFSAAVVGAVAILQQRTVAPPDVPAVPTYRGADGSVSEESAPAGA